MISLKANTFLWAL